MEYIGTDPADKTDASAHQKRSFLSWVHARSVPDIAFENSALGDTNTFKGGPFFLPFPTVWYLVIIWKLASS